MSTKFLHRELKALPRFVRRNGPLSAPNAADAVVLPNPFLPWRNPKTGRWAPPKYSLRQQADLIKQAKATNSVHLLPPSIKLPQPELFAPPPGSKIETSFSRQS
ncbi:Mitoc-mL59 domain-containing protein [Mycena venus]|uniref:Mitoc-mL59 domain-containing protein n=1 Tax=Mycena venus TaxID=2733690 RepID=A0A8H6Y825_9AGAR|nr:Mitoc-mL59 domain-containing protein [Mycena venus]